MAFVQTINNIKCRWCTWCYNNYIPIIYAQSYRIYYKSYNKPYQRRKKNSTHFLFFFLITTHCWASLITLPLKIILVHCGWSFHFFFKLLLDISIRKIVEWIRNWLLICSLEYGIKVMRIIESHIRNDREYEFIYS